MKEITFQIGDKLRIREWDDMLREFGGTYDGIEVPWGFFDGMRRLCGRDFTVKSIRIGTDGHVGYISEENAEDDFGITAECLEYRDQPQAVLILDDIQDDDFHAILGQQKPAQNSTL